MATGAPLLVARSYWECRVNLLTHGETMDVMGRALPVAVEYCWWRFPDGSNSFGTSRMTTWNFATTQPQHYSLHFETLTCQQSPYTTFPATHCTHVMDDYVAITTSCFTSPLRTPPHYTSPQCVQSSHDQYLLVQLVAGHIYHT